VIKGAVRQPGERAKVAVRSRERDVDPVGACVGMRGSRVQSIMRELHGEKIDVILYSDDLITFAQNALAPAKITRVSPIHHEDGSMSLDCVVEDDQLSLAIGKKGQNVRLASALIGMKIEIKGETEVKGEVAEALTRMLQMSRLRQMPVAEIPGIGEKTAEKLAEAGVGSLADLLEKSALDLSEIPGIGQATAEKILESARAAEEEVRNPQPVEAQTEEEGGISGEEETVISDEEVTEVVGEDEGESSQPAEETIVRE
jgi:N utilization substance protein A